MFWINEKEIYSKKKLIPYDAFAIWLYLFNKYVAPQAIELKIQKPILVSFVAW